MAHDPRPQRDKKSTSAGKVISPGIWLLLGLSCLFLAVALFAIAFIVTKSFQKQEVTSVRETEQGNSIPSSPTSSNKAAESPQTRTPNYSPTPEIVASATPYESPDRTPEVPSPPSESTAEIPSLTPLPEPSATPGDGITADQNLSLEGQATPPPVIANAQEENATRKEVLKRIDMVRDLTNKEKDFLYSQVERARGFSKLAIVPYGMGQVWPDAFQTTYLLENLAKAPIAKIFEDPTVVLVTVGYSDLKGSEERNLELSRTRAENLIKVLRRRTKITNLMRAVGMGGSDLFDKTRLEKNRVVEMWVVRP